MSFASQPMDQAQEAVALLKLMANDVRLLILCHLAEHGELSVGELLDRVELAPSALSQHLARLRDAGLVATRKEAQTVYYRIDDPRAGAVLELLHDLFCPTVSRWSAAAVVTRSQMQSRFNPEPVCGRTDNRGQ